MSEERDLDDVHHYIVPESQVDDLLAGREVAGEVSEGVTNISGLFAVLRQPPDVDEQMSAASLQRLMSMVGAHPDVDVSPRRAEMQPRIRKTKVTALAVALTLCTAGAAAAATGNLPGPLNWANSSGATHVAANAADAKADGSPSVTGLDNALNRITDAKTVPATTSRSTIASTTNPATTNPATTKPSATTDPSTSTLEFPTRYPPTTADASATQTAQPVGPDATGPAKHGLCNAYLDSLAKGHPKNPDAIAFRNLIAAATAAGQTVEQFCATTSPPTTTPPSTTVQTTTLPSTTEVATSPPSSKANGNGGGGGNGNGNGGGNGNGNGGSGGGASNGAHDSGSTASAAGSSNGQGHGKP